MSKVELGKIPFKHSKLEKNGTASNTVEKKSTYSSSVDASSTNNVMITGDATTSLRTKIAVLDLQRAVGDPEKIVPPPIGPGQPSAELSAALRKGLVGPENWLSQSDLELFRKVTGKSLRNGSFIDNNGQKSQLSKPESDLLNDLYQARNYGILGEYGFVLMSGKNLSSEDIEHILKYVKSQEPKRNLDLLERALGIISREEKNKAKESAAHKTIESPQI